MLQWKFLGSQDQTPHAPLNINDVASQAHIPPNLVLGGPQVSCDWAIGRATHQGELPVQNDNDWATWSTDQQISHLQQLTKAFTLSEGDQAHVFGNSCEQLLMPSRWYWQSLQSIRLSWRVGCLEEVAEYQRAFACTSLWCHLSWENRFVVLFLNGMSSPHIQHYIMATFLLAIVLSLVPGKPKCSQTLLFASLFGTMHLAEPAVDLLAVIVLATCCMWKKVTFQYSHSSSCNTHNIIGYAIHQYVKVSVLKLYCTTAYCNITTYQHM